ncbi:hypothetical protein PR202_ga13820 [Eleusine coracana subsp. coracana]|uniref:DUF1618 domain-containing protein n=1 Tax=Eleusine coracana subsp. coracana TaxID=191504 RepID=A0AAV5CFP7_ELECO|nr:hypothetical protein PR202_ga13820 [Eleusine coracana subsp. coracana]
MMSRNIVCIGGSIKFVCIKRRTPTLGQEKMELWTLDFESLKWKQEKHVFWEELRKQVIICTEYAHLQPRYPNLLPDGTLCLVLYNVLQTYHVKYDYLCNFDMSSKRLVSAGRFRHFDTTCPVVLGPLGLTSCAA